MEEEWGVVRRNLPLPVGERAGERGCNPYLFVIEKNFVTKPPP